MTVELSNGQIFRRRTNKKTLGQEFERIKNLYQEMSHDDLENINLSSNAHVIGDNEKNINVDKIKEILEKNTKNLHEEPVYLKKKQNLFLKEIEKKKPKNTTSMPLSKKPNKIKM